MSEYALTPAERKMLHKRARKTGYAHVPGGGPEGETCGTCHHIYRRKLSKTYIKCGLRKETWTGGQGTDILVRSPACKFWVKAAEVG